MTGLEKDIRHLETLVESVNRGERLASSINGLVIRIKNMVKELSPTSIPDVMLKKRFEGIMNSIKDERMLEVERLQTELKTAMDGCVKGTCEISNEEIDLKLKHMKVLIKSLKVELELKKPFIEKYHKLVKLSFGPVLIVNIMRKYGTPIVFTNSEASFLEQVTANFTEAMKT